jgi:hypothetical protein
MNEQDRFELQRLRDRQARLEQELSLLSAELTRLERRLNAPAPNPPATAAPSPVPSSGPVETPALKVSPAASRPAPQTVPTPPPPIPPVIPKAPPAVQSLPHPPVAAKPAATRTRILADLGKVIRQAHCQSCGRPIEFPGNAAGNTILCPYCGQSTLLSTEPATSPVPPREQNLPPAPAPSAAPAAIPAAHRKPEKERSFEMRLGTVWLVRIGILLVLTGLVFFGNLAYHDYVSKLGPGGKVSLLYLASGVLVAAGAWWQRKAVKPALKNYGQVLFAGGLAAVYFTTYAAYHFEPLRVIQNPLADGLLLLFCAGFMVWNAEHRKSEVLALVALGLAYYTSIITRVGLFTLYSNLVLTAASVVFLVRNRWAALSFLSLAATYTAYSFWRFFNGSGWHWASPEEGLWTGASFLIGYWVIFTTAVFLSKDTKFAGQNRAAFLTANNAAFFTLFVLTMWQVQTGSFWEFALVFGAVLLALAESARRFLAAEPLAKNTYLTQGLLVVTAGVVFKFAGMDLALMLALESVTLLLLGQLRKSLVLQTGAYITAAMAVGWSMATMKPFDHRGLFLGAGLGALMLFNAFLAHRQAASSRSLLRAQPGYFTVLALAVWLVATLNNTSREQFPVVLAIEAIGIILSIYLLRVREISLPGLAYLAIAQLVWSAEAFTGPAPAPWWNPVLMILLALGLSFWWQRQRVLDLHSQTEFGGLVFGRLPVFGKNLALFAGMHVAVELAGGWDFEVVSRHPAGGLFVPIGLGALMVVDTLLAHRQTPPAGSLRLRPQPSYSTVLALIIWLAVTWHNTGRLDFPLVLAAEGLLLTFSIYLLRVPEIALFGQGYILLAQCAWLVNSIAAGQTPPWWNPLLLVAITVVLGHWWQTQAARIAQVVSGAPAKQAPVQSNAGQEQDVVAVGLFIQAVYALAVVAVLYCWLSPQVGPPAWLALTSLLAIGLTVYGVAARAWWLAAFGQIFVLISGAQFAWQLSEAKPNWLPALAPMAALSLLSAGTVLWFRRKPDASRSLSGPLLQTSLIYRWVALAMSIWWVCAYIPERERVWLLALLGLWFFLWAGWRRSREALLFSAAFTVAALMLFWLPLLESPQAYWPNLLVIFVLLAQRQLARRLPDRYPLEPAAHYTVIIIGGLSLWLFLSRWVLANEWNSYLTACWSGLALALFTAGILLRERMYRWMGLGILACALGRVVVYDIWKLSQVFRVLSLMALGIVLLVLGFIYSKYQDKIKEWL